MVFKHSGRWWGDQLLLCLVVYPLGLTLGVLFNLLQLTGHIRVIGLERLRTTRGRLILACNHLSLLEPIFLPLLFLHRCWWNPWRIPWCTPDLKNYSWWWAWLRPRAVFVERGKRRAEMRALRRLAAVLRTGGSVIIFPEGGRTCSGTNQVFSPRGKELRQIKPGLSWLVKKTGVAVLPVWVEGTDQVLPNKTGRLYHCLPRWRGKQVTIRIGLPIHFDPACRRQFVSSFLESALLALADQDP